MHTSISNTLCVHEDAVQRSLSPLGRMIGLFSANPDPDHIKINGMRLKQLFEMAMIPSPMKIVISGTYEIDLHSVRHLLSEVMKQTGDQPNELGS